MANGRPRPPLNHRPERRAWRALCCAILLFAPAAALPLAEPADEQSTYFEDALLRINSGDHEGALIQLKNVLQLNPDHLPARILLGKTYLRLDRGAAAEVELRRALRMGADEDAVLVPLGNALLLQRKHQEILKIIRSSKPGGVGGAEILSMRGQAYFELGKLDEAEQAFSDAARLSPDRPAPLLGKARVLLARQQLSEAEDLIDRARVLAPDDAEVWYRKGEARQAVNDAAGAREAYDRALERTPHHMRARLARANVLVQLGEFEKARADAEFVRSESPHNAKAAFLLAQALIRLNRPEEAVAAFQVAVDRISVITEHALMEDPAALQLAALISFARNDLEQANRYLQQYLKLRPHHAAVSKLHGRVQLQLGDADGAIHTLFPVYRLMPDDTEVLALLGEAYLRKGRYVEASTTFEHAVELMAGESGLETRLALSKIGAGKTRDALEVLRRVMDQDTGTLRAGILLTLLYLRNGNAEEALSTARQLRDSAPDNPAVHNLVGSVKLKSGDFAGAREDLSKALELEPGFNPARFNLARLELHNGDFNAAQRLYQNILAREPRQAEALVGLADIALYEGRAADATDLLERASMDPANVDPQIRLVDLYLKRGQAHDALRRATRLSDNHPERADVLVTLARAQIAVDKRDDAILNYRRAVRFSSYSGEELMDIAAGQVGLQDFKGARWTLQKAAETKVADQAEAALVRLDLLTADPEAARARARDVLARRPESALGDILTAEILMHEKRYAQAVAAYEKGWEKERSFDVLAGLYKAYGVIGENAKGIDLLEQWTARNPGHLEASRTLALAYIPAGRLEEARERHEALLKDQPRDPVLLANLARIYQLTDDPRASAYAERAVSAAPEWSVSLDTLGWILVTRGEAAAGLPYLREALSRDGNPLIRYHVASALSELGRADEAKRELEQILRHAPQLEWIDDVRALYERL